MHCKCGDVVGKTEEVAEGSVASDSHQERGHFCKEDVHIALVAKRQAKVMRGSVEQRARRRTDLKKG
eukprot:4088237-Prorocentrum_lima.AAC.1